MSLVKLTFSWNDEVSLCDSPFAASETVKTIRYINSQSKMLGTYNSRDAANVRPRILNVSCF